MALLLSLFRCHFSRRFTHRLTQRLLPLGMLLSLIITNQPTSAATASNPNSDPRLQQAVIWATQQVSASRLWLDGGVTLCDMFVENAFGVTAQYPTAYDMYLALGKSGDPAHHTLADLQHAPPGAIVFFDKNAGNWNDGHVGVFVGNDQFISVVTGGHVTQHSVQQWNDHTSPFLGWAYPRADWPGYGTARPFSRPTPTAVTAPTARPVLPTPLPQSVDYAARTFQKQWHTDEAIAPNLWGPSLVVPKPEAYRDLPGGYRLVQYFDKGRMELANPKDGTVTNGLLATELITGQIQIGNDTFESHDPAAIPIAGDPDSPGPTYATLNGRAATLLAPASSHIGMSVSATVSAAGDVSEADPTSSADVRKTARADTTLSAYDSVTQHNVPAVFAAYRARTGVGVIGYAKSEPFVATVKIAGVQRQVITQVFERRVLTYNAANSDAFKVEMGNIGQHYYRWRYGQ
ncbi:MAG: C40 family peptidase [Chloroflexota bacterium]|nr:C40 family peptidase [Chloroflexota bacterium]